ncbi:UDP-glucosyltransferase 2-like isoform X1 [Aphis gossypii]|uniref:UDP-glucosyltransferase 2-like isoform X1 n=1 Tax=Aphis gossypii TaxID=80765 RepID=UPI0021596908|nr:UDP-glucosyltransferase 2-like isoform X1 [Aphis gossypii]
MNISQKSVVSILIFTLFSFTFIQPGNAARILAIETFAGKSHWNFMSAVLRALTDNGHNVTAFTPFLDGNRENYTEIDMSSMFEIKIGMDVVKKRQQFNNQLMSTSYMMKLGRQNCEILNKNDQLNNILANKLQTDFDAIIIEPGIISRCLSYIGKNSTLPVIHTSPIPINTYTERITYGDIHNPATVSTMLFQFAIPKTFFQRLTNTLVFLYTSTVIRFQEFLLQVIESKPYDLNIINPPSLVFTNTHFISDKPRPTPSNAVHVGGIHLKPSKKIPQDILDFIEDSPHGVILFTFGSTIAVNSLPRNILTAFKEAIAELPQKVLLKYEGEMEDKPKNVMTIKWLPQRDVLLHKNIKLFVSHGGISGLYEAVDAGVPVLGFPLFGDQHRNIDNLVESGMAVSMELFSITKDTFLKNVLDLVNNDKYTRNAKVALEIFKDRPMSPEKSVVYWTEYVIRHKGAEHLKSQALNLTWYQYFLLDVIALVILFICIVVLIVFKFLKFIRKIYTKIYSSYTKLKSD